MNNLITRRSFAKAAALSGIAASGALALAGCSAPAEKKDDAAKTDGKGLSVVASFYPMYDFAGKIGGDKVSVKCLVPAGTEPHDWEPATTDLKALEDAQVFVYNGSGMEHWVEDTVESLSNKKLVVVEATEGLQLLQLSAEELAEHRAEDPDAPSTDPHAWLSPLKVKEEMENIKDGLVKADSENKAVYESNYEKWAAECDKLDKEFKDGLADAKMRKIVVSHEAFGYLCDAYQLEQVAIEGIEPDAEPDAKTMAEIVEMVRAEGIGTIFSEELVSPKVAEAIAAASGAQVKLLNPIEGLTEEQLAKGEDYFSVMRANLATLKEALV